MDPGTSSVRKPLGWALAFGVTLALSGCGGGGGSPPQLTDADAKYTPGAAESAAQAKGKGKGGGDKSDGLTAQERRAAKLKEKQSAGQ
jgi:hypothetical protein